MAKRKAKKPLSEAQDLYLTRLLDVMNKEASELNQCLLFYEFHAKQTLIEHGYMTERGKWITGYNADALVGRGMLDHTSYEAYYTEREKMTPVGKAVKVFSHVRKCRESASQGDLEEAVLCMERVAYFSADVWTKEWKVRGGSKSKHKKGILALITQIINEPRNERASAQKLFDIIEKRYDGEDKALCIDGYTVFFDDDEYKVTQISPGGKKEGILFDAFKNYVYQARRKFLVSK